MACQLAGGIAGSLPLLIWGRTGSSIQFGATFPGETYSIWIALLGETITTFFLVFLLFIFIGHEKLCRFTPLLFPVLYAVMVYIEAPVSGTSTNPARSIGPSVISNVWIGWWIYWIGPIAGTLIAVAVYNFKLFDRFRIRIAKIYHFEHDRHGVFRKEKKK
jgi:aquaporin Z